MFKRVPGTKDILPEEVSYWQEIENISRKIFSIYNFSEIRPPILEEAALFNRSLGEFTEIVQKQMFLIKNKEDTYVLRPEGTASVVRAYIENNLHKTQGLVKFYYIGPMFRLERPQKGRLRQFHHIGAEVIGSYQPEIDIETISLADRLLREWGVSGYDIVMNNLGCLKDKKELMKILHDSLKGKLNNLCADCRIRFKNNVLRILDCKNEACQKVIKKLDIADKHACLECKTHFSAVKKGLDILRIKYQVNPYLVRGLDYYTRTVFEIKHEKLGAQDALGAGGRYDNLVKELGGPDIGAMGFAFGVERILLVETQKPQAESRNLVYVIGLGEKAELKSLEYLQDLRREGMPATTNLQIKSLKGAMRQANDLGARVVLIIGEDELKKNVITVKNMTSGEQKEIPPEKLLEEIKKQLLC